MFLTFASSASAKTVHIAGAQLEFPSHDEVLATLDKLVARHPQTELVILSEYTFDADPPKSVLKWCRDHSRYLIVGGKDHLPDGSFYNTAFVVSPDGEIIFRQAKKQPIQFFKDGKPAPSQQVWQSPWGRIGIAICYDFSYSRVIDELVRQGAQALIIPTMDVIDWGRAQHETHARLGPIRAAEYGVPVVRVCSSGVSQIVSAKGMVEQTLPFDGHGAMFASTLTLEKAGHLPPDRGLVRGCLIAALVLALFAAVGRASPPGQDTKSSAPVGSAANTNLPGGDARPTERSAALQSAADTDDTIGSLTSKSPIRCSALDVGCSMFLQEHRLAGQDARPTTPPSSSYQ